MAHRRNLTLALSIDLHPKNCTYGLSRPAFAGCTLTYGSHSTAKVPPVISAQWMDTWLPGQINGIAKYLECFGNVEDRAVGVFRRLVHEHHCGFRNVVHVSAPTLLRQTHVPKIRIQLEPAMPISFLTLSATTKAARRDPF